MTAPVKTELLAPAGSLDAFFAAMEFGADAVYCGLKEFSARAKAKNFTLAEVGQLTSYSHQQGKRLYLALNTLVKEAELPKLIDTLAGLATMGIDGLIIQDLGVWRLCRTHFPQIPLHASTQMTVHNAAGVQMLEQMGFSRAVLARELTLTEIRAIRAQTTMELEHFVHGALCFSISGQCLFSSALTGQSGNRGRCAQPCRRRYLHHQQPGYYFSPSDFCALDLLPELTSAGIMSLKIEGRMKSAEYVARVVAAYRRVLDAPACERKGALTEAHELLALAFGRQTTKGFLTGQLSAKLADPAQHGSLGQPLGTVASVRGGTLGFTTSDRLHVGDRLRVQPQNDQAGSGFTVRALHLGDKQVKAVKAGDFVRLPLPDKARCRPGDAVFKVGGKALFTLSPESCRKRLAESPVPAMTDKDKALLKTAQEQALISLLPAAPPAATTPRLMVRGRTIADLALLDNAEVDQLELPLNPTNLDQLAKAARRLTGQQERISWELPPILWEGEWREYRRAVQMLANQGYTRFRLNNLGHLPLFSGLAGVTLLGGFRCYSTNSQAALAWQELGLAELTASIEDDRHNLAALLSRELPLTVTIYAPTLLFLSRIPLRGLRPGTMLHAEKEQGYRLGDEEGLTTVSSEQDFSLLGRLHELRAMGADRLLVDLSRPGATSAKGREVLAAVADDRPLPATFDWNFDRGLA